MENGERPIFYGLIPSAEGEAIGVGYNYYHDYFALLGLKMAIHAVTSLNEEQDVKWMTETCDTLHANLLASVRVAFERVGLGKYIPATPFHPATQFELWGTMAALYPTRFLEPNDPMVSRTLEFVSQNFQEDVYGYFTAKKIFPYITADFAMCYLLRDDLSMFLRLYDGYVAHASSTNGWVEETFLESRLGTGDMPHGWAAAQYVHMHRNSLVFEDEDALHLCWGARDEWFSNGIAVKRAPTRFGTIDFELHRKGVVLEVNYRLVHGANQDVCRNLQLHIPPSAHRTTSIRVNGATRPLSPDQRVIQLEPARAVALRSSIRPCSRAANSSTKTRTFAGRKRADGKTA